MSKINLVHCLFLHLWSTSLCFWGAIFSGLNFYTLTKTLIACRDMQAQIVFVKQCLQNGGKRERITNRSESHLYKMAFIDIVCQQPPFQEDNWVSVINASRWCKYQPVPLKLWNTSGFDFCHDKSKFVSI